MLHYITRVTFKSIHILFLLNTESSHAKSANISSISPVCLRKIENIFYLPFWRIF